MLPLVMIPALCCDEALYAETAVDLADLVAPRTIMVSEPTLAQSVAAILARIDGPFIIMGTSFGGHVAREIALAAPERVKGLWIIGAGAGAVADPKAGRERSEALRNGRAKDVYRQFAETITYLPGPRGEAARDMFLAMTTRADPETVARQNDSLVLRPDRWNDLGRIACPALLLWGRQDSFSPAADGLRMASLISGARFAEIPDCGHLPTLEAPAETRDAARHWLMAAGLARV